MATCLGCVFYGGRGKPPPRWIKGTLPRNPTQMTDEWRQGCLGQLEVSSASGPQHESRLSRAAPRGKVSVFGLGYFPATVGKEIAGPSRPLSWAWQRGIGAVGRH